MNPVYIVDIIGEVVTAAKDVVLADIITNETAAIGSSLIQTIDYQYGHKRELIETLFQMDASKTQRFNKYPLIYLVQDFAEVRGNDAGFYAEVNLNIWIAHHTTAAFKITDRYEKVFKPVLYPIYYEFMDQLFKHYKVHEQNAKMIRHIKTDRSHWGRQAVGGNDQNKLNDCIDVIEIENLKLKINYQTNCLPSSTTF